MIKIKTYKFYTKTDAEGIVEHTIEAESCKKAYEILLISGYLEHEITMAEYKGKKFLTIILLVIIMCIGIASIYVSI